MYFDHPHRLPLFVTHMKGMTPSQMSELDGIKNGVKQLEMSTWRARYPLEIFINPNYNLDPRRFIEIN